MREEGTFDDWRIRVVVELIEGIEDVVSNSGLGASSSDGKTYRKEISEY
jgi:hypothetical protein